MRLHVYWMNLMKNQIIKFFQNLEFFKILKFFTKGLQGKGFI